MNDTTDSLRRKIDSAGDLQSAVRTMKVLAASSIGHYEQSVRALDSTNFDSRSFSLNDEANLNYYDVDFTRRQKPTQKAIKRRV